MRIEGLTRRQAALCKVIWSCTTAEEIAKFIVTLPESDQKICDGLLQLLNYEYLEEDAKLNSYEEFPDVEDILKEIKKKDANGYYNNLSRSEKNGKSERKVRRSPRRTKISTPSVERKNRPPRKKPEPPCEA